MEKLNIIWAEKRRFDIANLTETAIVAISKICWYPDLNTSDKAIEETKRQIDLLVDTREALELIKKIDFKTIDTQALWEMFYYLESSNNSSKVVNYIEQQWIEVVFIDVWLQMPIVFLKLWDTFYNPNIWKVELSTLYTPNISSQWIIYYSWVSFNWITWVLKVTTKEAVLEKQVWEIFKLWKKDFIFIKNTFWDYDILDVSNGILYKIWCKGFEIDRSITVKLFLDAEKTIYMEFDGYTFWEQRQIIKTSPFDLSDTDTPTTEIKKH